MKTLENEIKEVKRHLRQLTEYAIAWYEKLREKYSKDRERKTELRIFDKVEATQVALANAKLYVNREEGFIGSGMKKDEFVCDCSDIDDIIVFREDGKYVVSKIQDKVFVGKGIIHVAVFKKVTNARYTTLSIKKAKLVQVISNVFLLLALPATRNTTYPKDLKDQKFCISLLIQTARQKLSIYSSNRTRNYAN
ncbi:hypothetical protein KUH03_06625 [Sphingobacterium sp. E70]|nr:hypothetical protein [Sphingobacterium sp. E70]ULT26530.1 hypothetical protein KUH03_06625 [Sphingobacterium sp. E70]